MPYSYLRRPINCRWVLMKYKFVCACAKIQGRGSILSLSLELENFAPSSPHVMAPKNIPLFKRPLVSHTWSSLSVKGKDWGRFRTDTWDEFFNRTKGKQQENGENYVLGNFLFIKFRFENFEKQDYFGDRSRCWGHRCLRNLGGDFLFSSLSSDRSIYFQLRSRTSSMYVLPLEWDPKFYTSSEQQLTLQSVVITNQLQLAVSRVAC
jgi:hypothetical protein